MKKNAKQVDIKVCLKKKKLKKEKEHEKHAKHRKKRSNNVLKKTKENSNFENFMCRVFIELNNSSVVEDRAVFQRHEEIQL